MSKISIVKEVAETAIKAESERIVHLLRKAELYAAGIIIVTGFQLLDVKTLLESSSQWVKILCYASLGVLGLALFFAFRGMRLKGHADYPRGNKLWANLKPDDITEEAAQEALVQMLLETQGTERALERCQSQGAVLVRLAVFRRLPAGGRQSSAGRTRGCLELTI